MDSDDLLYLKEQMEAEEDAERLLRRTEKRAFAAFKISFYVYWKREIILNLAIGYPLTWLLFHDSVKEEEDLLISV